MSQDYSKKNLQKASFKNADLSNAHFSYADLRGTDFSGSNLSGANFSNSKTGIPPVNMVLIFIVALLVSALSGYVATLAGSTVQLLLKSGDPAKEASGIIALAIILLFVIYSIWKGVGKAIRTLIIPASITALTLGAISYLTGVGTGMGMVYLVLAFILVSVMFIIGTIARAAAGSLSNILFIVVALAGGLFGKSVGGGIGTVIMAVSCAMISKRALSGAKGFELLQKMATQITRRFGTSFRSSQLTGADFSHSQIRNADFTGAEISSVIWNNSKRINCIMA